MKTELSAQQIYNLPMPRTFGQDAVWTEHDLSAVRVRVTPNGARRPSRDISLGTALHDAERQKDERGDESFETIGDALAYLEDGNSITIIDGES